MNPDPLISVVVIFYNPGQFFTEALDSVCAQTYGNWELLLCDDGSTDGSSEIAQRYVAQLGSKARYLQHANGENRGMGATRNLGLSTARGHYIALLDADDFWLPNKLAEQVGILEAHPEAALLYGRSRIWHSWTGKPEDRDRDWINQSDVVADRIVSPPELLVRWLKNEAYQPCTSEILVRTDIVQKLGGWEAGFRGLYEDNVLYTKIFLNYSVYFSSHTWSYYRQHESNCCHTAMKNGEWALGKPSAAKERILLWVEQYLAENTVTYPEVSATLQTALLAYRNPALYQIRTLPSRAINKLKYALAG